MPKKLLLTSLISLISIALLLLITWMIIVPRSDIQKLEKGYVEVTYENKKVEYKITDKKPSSWIVLTDIPKSAYQAIVISEDWAFFEHEGVDVNQLKKATLDSVSGKRTRGASTISQQVVKNLFLTPEKTMSRKLKEVLITLYLEQNVSKTKILEIYLNIIEYGEGLYGIENASRHYFKKSSSKLTVREGAFLAMLLPNPKRHAESFRKKELTPFAQKIVNNILKKMKMAHFLTKEQFAKESKGRFSWEKRSTQNSGFNEQGLEGDSKTIHEKLRDNLENTTDKIKKNLPPGETFEKKYKEDRDTLIGDEPDYDPDALIEDESGLEEEFRVD
ncbi:MAG: transglycosylase domain-containing protein [Bacteriovoracaceae bacterium]|nr:transglycosylase domain-containing protein [Bacteriovoracaceae bacterium]